MGLEAKTCLKESSVQSRMSLSCLLRCTGNGVRMISSLSLNDVSVKVNVPGQTFRPLPSVSVVPSVSSVVETAGTDQVKLKYCPMSHSLRLSTPKSNKTECLTRISHSSKCLQNFCFCLTVILTGQE